MELNKKEAPSLLLEDYNYFINKAVNHYINKVYNFYDVNQQKTDDLRVLKSTSVLTPLLNNDYGTSDLFSKVYETYLPDDYLHILNCVVEYDVNKSYKCYNKGDKWHQGARRLTADMYGQIINNYYLRPTYKMPYYYINNVGIDTKFPETDTNVYIGQYYYTLVPSATTEGNGVMIVPPKSNPTVTYIQGIHYTTISQLKDLLTTNFPTWNVKLLNNPSTFLEVYPEDGWQIVNAGNNFTIEKFSINFTSQVVSNKTNGSLRRGNYSKVRLEIRYGKDNSIFALSKVYVDYLKAPQFIRLTQDQVDEVDDNSQTLEFPDYVCQEIVNELIKLLMENASDPRLQTHIPINQSIANPSLEQPNNR